MQVAWNFFLSLEKFNGDKSFHHRKYFQFNTEIHHGKYSPASFTRHFPVSHFNFHVVKLFQIFRIPFDSEVSLEILVSLSIFLRRRNTTNNEKISLTSIDSVIKFFYDCVGNWKDLSEKFSQRL